MKYFPPKFLAYLIGTGLLAVFLSTRTGRMGFESTFQASLTVGAINWLFSIALTSVPFILFLILEIIFSKDHSISDLVIFIIFCLVVIGLIRFLPGRYIYRYIQCVTEGCSNQLYEE
ncbi:MAG: hypothetical protein AB7S78_02700 [Candidatus Omnitrophota bacterium]